MLTFEAKFESGIPAYMEQLDGVVRRVTAEAAAGIAMMAQGLAPYSTGSLRDTIDFEQVFEQTQGFDESGAVTIQWQASWSANKVVWSVNAGNLAGGYKGDKQEDKAQGSPVDYAAAQEYGLSTGRHTPYMTPAAESGWANFEVEMDAAIAGISGGMA